MTFHRVMSSEYFSWGGYPLPSRGLGFGISFSHEGPLPSARQMLDNIRVMVITVCSTLI